MHLSSVVLLSVLALASTQNCPTKRLNSKLICYYSKLTDVDSCHCSHIILPVNSDIKSVTALKEKLSNVKVLLTANEFNQGLLTTVKQNSIDGLEINLKKLSTKDDITEFINTVRTKLGQDLYLALSVPARTEHLAKYYDMKALSKTADLFILQTAFLGASQNVTFHPSRLSGMWDMQNTDSVVDLITGLGAPLSKLAIAAPVQAFQFKLQDKARTTPGSPALEVRSLTRDELCTKMNAGNWTLERDQDQAGPYIFRNDEWVAFEDSISMDIKAKYARVRGLAGIALKDVSQDGGKPCGPNLLQAAYTGLSKQNRAPRGAVLRSLEREILETPARPLNTVQVSPYRISRVIDVEGHVHTIRQDTRTEFECSRQGYFVHPRSCGRFYRCVKFDQNTEEFSVFEFDCPAGLAFDSRWEVCVWPGSLPHGAPCSGSSEIAPVPRDRFACPQAAGYYADPENCRWFFACLDHGKSGLTAYEFRCPFGLVFDEQRLVCEWPWLVPSCKSGYITGIELDSLEFYGGHGLNHDNGAATGTHTYVSPSVHAFGSYDGLGELGTIALGGLNNLGKFVAVHTASGASAAHGGVNLQTHNLSGNSYLIHGEQLIGGKSISTGHGILAGADNFGQGYSVHSKVNDITLGDSALPVTSGFVQTQNQGNLAQSIIEYGNGNLGTLHSSADQIVHNGNAYKDENAFGKTVIDYSVLNDGISGFNADYTTSGNVALGQFGSQNILQKTVGASSNHGLAGNLNLDVSKVAYSTAEHNAHIDHTDNAKNVLLTKLLAQDNIGVIHTPKLALNKVTYSNIEHGNIHGQFSSLNDNVGGKEILIDSVPKLQGGVSFSTIQHHKNEEQLKSNAFVKDISGSGVTYVNSGPITEQKLELINLQNENVHSYSSNPVISSQIYGVNTHENQAHGQNTAYSTVQHHGKTHGTDVYISQPVLGNIETVESVNKDNAAYSVQYHGNHGKNIPSVPVLVNGETVKTTTHYVNTPLVQTTKLVTPVQHNTFEYHASNENNLGITEHKLSPVSTSSITYHGTNIHKENNQQTPNIQVAQVNTHSTYHNILENNLNNQKVELTLPNLHYENKAVHYINSAPASEQQISTNGAKSSQSTVVHHNKDLNYVGHQEQVTLLQQAKIEPALQYQFEQNYGQKIVSVDAPKPVSTFTQYYSSTPSAIPEEKIILNAVPQSTSTIEYHQSGGEKQILLQPQYNIPKTITSTVHGNTGYHSVEQIPQSQVVVEAPRISAQSFILPTPKPIISTPVLNTYYTVSTPRPTFASTIAPFIKQTPKIESKIVPVSNILYSPVHQKNERYQTGYVNTVQAHHSVPAVDTRKQTEYKLYSPYVNGYENIGNVNYYQYGSGAKSNQHITQFTTHVGDKLNTEQVLLKTPELKYNVQAPTSIHYGTKFLHNNAVLATGIAQPNLYSKSIVYQPVQNYAANFTAANFATNYVPVTPKSFIDFGIQKSILTQEYHQPIQHQQNPVKYESHFYGKSQQYSPEYISKVDIPVQNIAISKIHQPIVTAKVNIPAVTHTYIQPDVQTATPKYESQFYGINSEQYVHVDQPVQRVVQTNYETVTPKYETQFYGTNSKQHVRVNQPVLTEIKTPLVQVVQTNYETATPKYDSQFYGTKTKEYARIEPFITEIKAPVQVHQTHFEATSPKYESQFYGVKSNEYVHGDQPVVTEVKTPVVQQIIQTNFETVTPKYDTQYYGTNTKEYVRVDQPVLTAVKTPVQQVIQTNYETATPKYESQFYGTKTKEYVRVDQPIITEVKTPIIQQVIQTNYETASPKYESNLFGTKSKEYVHVDQPILTEIKTPVVQQVPKVISPVQFKAQPTYYQHIEERPALKVHQETIINRPTKIESYFTEPTNIPSQEFLQVPVTTSKPLINQQFNQLYVSTPAYPSFKEVVLPKDKLETTRIPSVVTESKYENSAYINNYEYKNIEHKPSQLFVDQPQYQEYDYYSEKPQVKIVPVQNYKTEYVLSTPKPNILTAIAPVLKQTPRLQTKVVKVHKYGLDDGFTLSTPKTVGTVEYKSTVPFSYYDSLYDTKSTDGIYKDERLVLPVPQYVESSTYKPETYSTNTFKYYDSRYDTKTPKTYEGVAIVSTAQPDLKSTYIPESNPPEFKYYDSRYDTQNTHDQYENNEKSISITQKLFVSSTKKPEIYKSNSYENYDDIYEIKYTTPKTKLFVSTLKPDITDTYKSERVPTNSYNYYDSRYKVKSTTEKYVAFEEIENSKPEQVTYKSVSFPSASFNYDSRYDATPATYVTSEKAVIIKSRPTVSSSPKYDTKSSTPEQYLIETTDFSTKASIVKDDTDYIITTYKPKILTTRPILRKKILTTTTAAPLDAYEDFESNKYVSSTQATPTVAVKITPKPKGKTIVRVNDFHPFLTTKLGAQCTCTSNTVKLRNSKNKNSEETIDYDYNISEDVPVTKITSEGPASYDDISEPGVYVVGNYDYEPKKITITQQPEVISTTNAAQPAPTPNYLARKKITQGTRAPVDIPQRKTITESRRQNTKTKEDQIADAVKEGLSLVKSAIKGYVKEAIDEERNYDRYGPGGWRSRDETLQGSVDCQREGLFRHPTQCNKFYACRWDCTKQRYTLHVFNCPVHLTFDSTMSACNWPSKGPACSGNTLLPTA